MSEKQTKRYRRAVRKEHKKIIETFIDIIKEYSLKDRIRFAYYIIFKKHVNLIREGVKKR